MLCGGVVKVLKTHLKTQQQGHVILFSTDLALTYHQLIDLYSLRFQIEFDFRDAKQFWGLEDFMNISQTAVTNAVNLAFFMVNLSRRLLLAMLVVMVSMSVILSDIHLAVESHVPTLKLIQNRRSC